MGWSSRPLQHAEPPLSLRFPGIITLTGIAWIFCAGRHLNTANGSVTEIVGVKTLEAYRYRLVKKQQNTVAIPKLLKLVSACIDCKSAFNGVFHNL